MIFVIYFFLKSLKIKLNVFAYNHLRERNNDQIRRTYNYHIFSVRVQNQSLG
jgi:hypothetical protein